jgi:transcriptional regulator with GAF, ATPase, and Fis domain
VSEQHIDRDASAHRRPALDEDSALRLLLEGTAKVTGKDFFRSLVKSLAGALGTHGAWVTEYDAPTRMLRALAFYMDGKFIAWQARIDGTPCERVIDESRLLLYSDRVLDIYPDEPDLNAVGAVSYMGVPLKDEDGSVLGHLAVLDTAPMPEEPRLLTVFQLFADRASAELRRVRAESAVREREEKLARLVDGAMDAIVELDDRLIVTHVNSAAETIFRTSAAKLVGADFRGCLSVSDASKLGDVVRALDRDAAPERGLAERANTDRGIAERANTDGGIAERANTDRGIAEPANTKRARNVHADTDRAQTSREQAHSAREQANDDPAHTARERAHTWIAGGLRARAADGSEFPAEATISRHRRGGKDFHTLILRDVNDRVRAEERIRSLTVEASCLRDELRTLGEFGEILGKSDALLGVLHDVEQVAATDASVLILGETGTGKELVARAIHARSPRREKPLVRVNCAAIPNELVESELFGHEKGAFTGATAKREGRFELADQGTIFLDEIGELSTDVQVKLLRVLQEGEFEPVGSSRTRKVDVRVLSATNRDLAASMRSGGFREDLYYRLSVFPIELPPLRERGDDVVLLAEAFVRKFARKMGRSIAPLEDGCKQRLRTYEWPGNVRELANVIERAVITARDGCLNLERAIPDSNGKSEPDLSASDAPGRIRTVDDLARLERENILRALEVAQWQVAGERGAAALLGMKPSTLASRMKALGVARRGE